MVKKKWGIGQEKKYDKGKKHNSMIKKLCV